jgi:hypothetical protein
MESLLRSLRELPTGLVTGNSNISRHICPSCSDILLRHIRSGEIYWRCSTCYQAMPVCDIRPGVVL